jgi:HAMP domain-containing protein
LTAFVPDVAPGSVTLPNVTAILTPDAALARADADGPTTGSRRFGLRVSMRWKLLIAFGLVFTVVFVLIAAWILRFSTNTATDRVTDTLRGLAIGGATTIDPDAFVELATTSMPPEIGALYPANAGYLAGTPADADSVYPTDPRYWAHVNELFSIRGIDGDASPYSYWLAPDGTLQAVGSWGALGCGTLLGEESPEPCGFAHLQDVREFIDEETAGYFAQGLVEPTQQPGYEDTLGSWITAYAPIRDAGGAVVGAIGVDYLLSYVDGVRSDVVRVLYPVFGVAYVFLLVLVFWVSGWFTKRISRLSSATQRVAEGDYDVDLGSAAKAVFRDEMTELANSFSVMTDKVGARERTLVQQVQVLKVEIDEQKRQAAVSEIVDSDFFADLTSKAAAIRKKVKDSEDAAAEEANRVD